MLNHVTNVANVFFLDWFFNSDFFLCFLCLYRYWASLSTLSQNRYIKVDTTKKWWKNVNLNRRIECALVFCSFTKLYGYYREWLKNDPPNYIKKFVKNGFFRAPKISLILRHYILTIAHVAFFLTIPDGFTLILIRYRR